MPIAKTQSDLVETIRKNLLTKPSSSKFNLEQFVKDLRATQIADLSSNTLNLLLLGLKGVGKTQIAITCPEPILIHSFDPGGTKHLKPEIAAGKVIVDTTFEKLNIKSATVFSAWEAELNRLMRADAFKQIGTYVVDSFTSMLYSLKLETARKKGRAENLLQIQDWQIIINTLNDYIRMCMSLPCHVIFTGHLVREKDDISGAFITKLDAPPSMQNALPILFDEVYCMVAEGTGDKARRVLYTSSSMRYTAATRLGRGRFKPIEEPNIIALLKKIDMLGQM